MHYFVRPRIVLLGFLAGCIVLIAPAIRHTGVPGIVMLYFVLFFESVCFPTIVALGMRGLGRHSKRGSGYIVAGKRSGSQGVPTVVMSIDDSFIFFPFPF